MVSEGCFVVLVAASGSASRLEVWRGSTHSVAVVGTMLVTPEMFRIRIRIRSRLGKHKDDGGCSFVDDVRLTCVMGIAISKRR